MLASMKATCLHQRRRDDCISEGDIYGSSVLLSVTYESSVITLSASQKFVIHVVASVCSGNWRRTLFPYRIFLHPHLPTALVYHGRHVTPRQPRIILLQLQPQSFDIMNGTNGHSGEPLISGLAHVNLTIPRGTLDQAFDFYGNTLGLTSGEQHINYVGVSILTMDSTCPTASERHVSMVSRPYIRTLNTPSTSVNR